MSEFIPVADFSTLEMIPIQPGHDGLLLPITNVIGTDIPEGSDKARQLDIRYDETNTYITPVGHHTDSEGKYVPYDSYMYGLKISPQDVREHYRRENPYVPPAPVETPVITNEVTASVTTDVVQATLLPINSEPEVEDAVVETVEDSEAE